MSASATVSATLTIVSGIASIFGIRVVVAVIVIE